MKWFKHQNDLARDEGIRLYLERSEKDWMEAYGFLMLILENIGEKMSAKPGDLHCSAAYTLKGWSNILGCHRNRVSKYMRLLPVIPWVDVEFEGGICMVTAERMYEWRDETTRKSKSTPERFAQRRTDKIRKDEREINNDALSNKRLNNGSSHTPPSDFKVTDELRQWASAKYPDVDIEAETEKFLRHEFRSPRDNWENAWKTWIQKAYEYGARDTRNPQGQDKIYELLNLGRDLNFERKNGESDAEYSKRVDAWNKQRIARHDA